MRRQPITLQRSFILDYDQIREARLKREQLFKEHPEAGKVTLGARATIVKNYLKEATTREFTLLCDEPSHTGGVERGYELGQNKGPRALEYFLAGAALCQLGIYTGYMAVLNVKLDWIEVSARGSFDQRSIYGIRKAPKGFQTIELLVKMTGSADRRMVRQLVRNVRNRCPAHATLGRATKLVDRVWYNGERLS
jgi:uncharacterized OsmC-like protein